MNKTWTKEQMTNAFRTMVEMRKKWEYCVNNKLSRDEAAEMGVKYADIITTNAQIQSRTFAKGSSVPPDF